MLCIGLLLLLVGAAFLPVLRNGFISWDDGDYILSNPHVRTGVSWENIRWAFGSFENSNWHPLTWISHMVDCEIFGLRAWGHHLTSLALHALNTLLVFLVLRRMTSATWRSFAVAALFAVHPLRVESVAWAAERKDVLSALFFLLTLLCYAERLKCGVRNAECGTGKVVSDGWKWYGAALGFFALGLMSKPMVVTLPFVLLLIDYWSPRRTSNSREQSRLCASAFPDKVPFFLLAAASCVVTYEAQRRGGSVQAMLPMGARIENAVVSYLRYLGKMIWPVDLAVFYPFHQSWSAVEAGMAILLVVGVSVVAVATQRRIPYLAVGWFWFVGMLVPTIGLVQVGGQSMADRYTYLPMIGVLIAAVWRAEDLMRTRYWRPVVLQLTLGVVLILCVGMTRRQVGFWRNSETLARHAITVTGDNEIAYEQLGQWLDSQGDAARALDMYQRSVTVNPFNADGHNTYGNALLGAGKYAEALREFESANRVRPEYFYAYNGGAIALEKLGRLADAERRFHQALALKPDYYEAHLNFGDFLWSVGRREEALKEFQEIVRLRPGEARAHLELGCALADLGQREEAIVQLKETKRLQPDSPLADERLRALGVQ